MQNSKLTCHPDGMACSCTKAKTKKALCDTMRCRDETALYEVGSGTPLSALMSPPLAVPELRPALPEDDAARLEFPMFDGLMAYFPNALAEVSRVSKIGNDQHNPGEPMYWARDKSTDHENKIMRHLADVGTKDPRGVRHSARLAWRALALLQEEVEREEGFAPSRASRNRPY